MATEVRRNVEVRYEPHSYRSLVDYLNGLDAGARVISEGRGIEYVRDDWRIVLVGREGESGCLVLNEVSEDLLREIRGRVGGRR